MAEIVPPEYAWIIPILIPFLIGLLAGVILKRALKLILAIIVLIVILVAIGYVQLPPTGEILQSALTYLPRLWAEAGPFINILPYSSATFLIGLALGLWKG